MFICKSIHEFVEVLLTAQSVTFILLTRGMIAGSSMQMQILEALRSGERKKASDLLLDFGHTSHSLTADDFVDIFKYCARSPDPLVC